MFFLHRMELLYLQEVKHNPLLRLPWELPLDELLIESAAKSDYSKFYSAL